MGYYLADEKALRKGCEGKGVEWRSGQKSIARSSIGNMGHCYGKQGTLNWNEVVFYHFQPTFHPRILSPLISSTATRKTLITLITLRQRFGMPNVVRHISHRRWAGESQARVEISGQRGEAP